MWDVGVGVRGVSFWGGGVVRLVGDMVVVQGHMHNEIWGYMHWGYSIGWGCSPAGG